MFLASFEDAVALERQHVLVPFDRYRRPLVGNRLQAAVPDRTERDVLSASIAPTGRRVPEFLMYGLILDSD